MIAVSLRHLCRVLRGLAIDHRAVGVAKVNFDTPLEFASLEFIRRDGVLPLGDIVPVI